ncbi:DUF2207 domain-containing protein [Aestuariivirga litoralis]|uniref:DUF2207 domain-containing protein n=1 Tax=Aestuariivirga litoralis TaxID=2650924 RepID=A0A2W2AU76_9HYPH|nr:DUF2207 domain-containing protein [Aestuariivirga litoralis]PZF77252.1 DUF2207 domain-containing protein [Aestuariivirga litoralis]
MRRLLAFLLLAVMLAAPAQAEERIRNFISSVTVNADASINVTETIIVNSEGRAINHGIFRDFPTTYTDAHGQRVIVGFTVLDVKRDGQDEPYSLEPLSNGTRIRIGDKDVWLENAQHRYEISYRTTRQIGFFGTFDELYWNVTGNGWDFPIDMARVTITLPPGARILQHDEFTGGYRSTENNSRVLSLSGNVFTAETTAALDPRQGFTVAVAWQKGLVTPPSDAQKWAWWASDNAGFFTLALGLLATALYFLFAWNKVGRDPPRGTIIPLFAPPKGLGPSAVRFVSRYGADDKGFAAAMVGLAVKGRLRIADDDRTFTITKLKGGNEPLTPAESALYLALPSGSTELKQTNHASISAARNALDRALKNEFEGTAFLRNLGWFAVGLAISVLCLVIGAFLLPGAEGVQGLFAFGWMGVWWGVVLAVGWASFKGLFAARGLWARITSLGALLFLIPFAGGGIVAPALIFSQGGGSPGLYALVGTAMLLGLLNVVFYHLLRAPTQSGRQLMDQIEGFRLYLSTAEEERLKVLHPPEKTPELFERYLPYALALDCENEWNAKFAAVLAAAAAAGAAAPAWYSGRSWGSGGMGGGFTDSLGRGLASSAAAAATAPGRSSGSGGGGGGFSGGGGGGGGGGGW